ncbi:MAG: hypothetical protein WC779_00190 [Candidatus Omnitrophota bacterium]
MKDRIKRYMRAVFFNDIMAFPYVDVDVSVQKERDYIDWIYSDIVGLVEELVKENAILDSAFIKGMNVTFKTNRFDALLRKFIGDYLVKLFRVIDYYSRHEEGAKKLLVLEDDPVNRFAVKKYSERFKAAPRVRWVKRGHVLYRIFVIFFQALFILYYSLNTGVIFFRVKKKFKVMRELVLGFHPLGGYYFHDDFLIDEMSIKKNDLLFFSRKDIKTCEQRNGAYQQARSMQFNTFYLPSLKIGLGTFFFRVAPLYMAGGMGALLAEVSSANFSMFSSISRYFLHYALPYEKVFSNYEIGAEINHDYYSTRHIVESIICQNAGTRYYLMHWSDMSLDVSRYGTSFLGCDKYFVWGHAHIRGSEGPDITMCSGYIFKRFIKKVQANRSSVMSDIGIRQSGKVVTFFDESFGGGFPMTAEHHVNFWKTALELATKEPKLTVIMKPKELSRYRMLPRELRDEFLEIKKRIEELDNTYIINTRKWSFIEFIGISDIVVTASMTSSGTIAIICGIEGLYLDEAGLDHPFSKILKDKGVFKESDKLLKMIREILNGEVSVLSEIPKDAMRSIDEYPDDRGIDVVRAVLTRNESGVLHN